MGVLSLKDASLDQLYDRGTQLRKELAELPDAEIRSDDQTRRVRAICDEAVELDTTITLLELEDRRSHQPVIANEGGIRSMASGQEVLTIGDKVTSGELGKEWMVWDSHGDDRRAPRFYMNFEDEGSGAQMFNRAVQEFAPGGPFGTYDSSGAGNLLPVGQPIAPIPRQARLYLRDLIPTMTTTLAQIPYVQELNPLAYESASAVGEGSNKPNATLSFQGAKADP